MKRLRLLPILLLLCSACWAGEISASSPQEDILSLVNQFRTQNGLGTLTRSPNLETAAQAYAVTLATQSEFSHTIGGTTATGRVQGAGYQGGYVGENIARGFTDAPSVMVAWENSPGHRANLLNPNFTELGVGVADGPFRMSWVQDFGARYTPPPIPAPTPVPVPTPPIVPPVTPPTPAPAPSVSLVGKFGMYRDTTGNYFLLPIQ